MNEYIKYTGENRYFISGDFSKENGVTYLTKDKIYKLASKWPTGLNINDHWVFYIYDDIEDGDVRGYEIPIKDVETLRDVNLDILLH